MGADVHRLRPQAGAVTATGESNEARLVSIDDGTYGTCTNCGNPIGAERLEAIPWAPTCIDCARKLER